MNIFAWHIFFHIKAKNLKFDSKWNSFVAFRKHDKNVWNISKSSYANRVLCEMWIDQKLIWSESRMMFYFYMQATGINFNCHDKMWQQWFIRNFWNKINNMFSKRKSIYFEQYNFSLFLYFVWNLFEMCLFKRKLKCVGVYFMQYKKK